MDQQLRDIISKNHQYLHIEEDESCDQFQEESIKNESDSDISDFIKSSSKSKEQSKSQSEDSSRKARKKKVRILNEKNNLINSEDDPFAVDAEFDETNDDYKVPKEEKDGDVFKTTSKKSKKLKKSEVVLIATKYPCMYCGKLYKQKKRLDSHLKNHLEEKPDDVTVKTELDKDLVKVVKEEIVSEPDITDMNVSKERLSSCENCGEHFQSLDSLEEHYKELSCQPKNNLTTSSNEVKNIVDYLNVGKRKKPVKEEDLDEPEYIKGRRLKGKRRFLCNYCGKNYTRKNGLERHILSHTGVKPFECRECGKRYTTKDTLKTHLLTHTGVKAYKCEICQKSFTQSSHLSYHMRRHAGEKPHVCSFCGKGFLSSYHLERHKLMHTGVKPFECNLCGKRFVRSTTLRDHLLIHTGEKPFQCQHCGKQFNRKQSLTNHMLVHTGQPKTTSSYLGPSVLYNELNIPDVSNIQNTIETINF